MLVANFFIAVGVGAGVGVVVGSEWQKLGTILFTYALRYGKAYIYIATYGLICIGTYTISIGLFILFSTVHI